jgi:hypothetical protein
MPDILITVVSGETTELGLSIPGVQGPVGQGVQVAALLGNLLLSKVQQIMIRRGARHYQELQLIPPLLLD